MIGHCACVVCVCCVCVCVCVLCVLCVVCVRVVCVVCCVLCVCLCCACCVYVCAVVQAFASNGLQEAWEHYTFSIQLFPTSAAYNSRAITCKM